MGLHYNDEDERASTVGTAEHVTVHCTFLGNFLPIDVFFKWLDLSVKRLGNKAFIATTLFNSTINNEDAFDLNSFFDTQFPHLIYFFNTNLVIELLIKY